MRETLALQVGVRSEEGVAATELVRPIGTDEKDARVAELAREMTEEIEARIIGPMKVLK